MHWTIEFIQKSFTPGRAVVCLRNNDDPDNLLVATMFADDLKRKDVRIGDSVVLKGGGEFLNCVVVLRVNLFARTGEETAPYYMEETA